MPPGEDTAPKDIEIDQMEALQQQLNNLTVQQLRQAAREANWPVRGVAKAEIVEQLAARLADPVQMQAVVNSLPPEERAVLAWTPVFGHDRNTTRRLQAVLGHGMGHNLTQKAIDALLERLASRCLIFKTTYYGYHIPALYRQWLPSAEAPKLLYNGQPTPAAPSTMVGILDQVDLLLQMVASAQPSANLPSRTARYGPRVSFVPLRPYLVDQEHLVRWGFSSAADQQLARFLLEQMLILDLVRVVLDNQTQSQLVPGKNVEEWQEMPLADRLLRLRWAALSTSEMQPAPPGTWTEVDLALPKISGYELKPNVYYIIPETLTRLAMQMRARVLAVIITLPPNTWHSFDSLATFFYHIMRDPLTMGSEETNYLGWSQNNTLQSPQQMNSKTWRETSGRLLETVLTGPGQWLVMLQLSYEQGKLAAVRWLSETPVGTVMKAPSTALTFAQNGDLLIYNSRWMGSLRRLASRISTETARTADNIVMRPTPSVLRQTLRHGVSVEQVAEEFAAAGFPLPAALHTRLLEWQARAGRHQLYDNLAVIEVTEDGLSSEIQAIASRTGIEFYQITPRCLLLPDPTTVPGLVAELSKRGYTPQVLS